MIAAVPGAAGSFPSRSAFGPSDPEALANLSQSCPYALPGPSALLPVHGAAFEPRARGASIPEKILLRSDELRDKGHQHAVAEKVAEGIIELNMVLHAQPLVVDVLKGHIIQVN